MDRFHRRNKKHIKTEIKLNENKKYFPLLRELQPLGQSH
jgi:hypothetical protein